MHNEHPMKKRTVRDESLRPSFKLWISSPRAEGVFGDGKWRLLRAIEREGSLKKAAGALGMSYRKAWGDLKKAQTCLGITLVALRRGGAGGGEAFLTDIGRKWLAAYGRLRTNLERTLAREFARTIGRIGRRP